MQNAFKLKSLITLVTLLVFNIMNAQEHKSVTEALGLSVGDSVPSF